MTSSSLTTDIPDTLTLKHYAGKGAVCVTDAFLLHVVFLEGCSAACDVPSQPRRMMIMISKLDLCGNDFDTVQLSVLAKWRMSITANYSLFFRH